MRPVRIGRRILVAVAIAALAFTIAWHLRPAGRQRGVELPPVAVRALHPADIADAPEVVARLLADPAHTLVYWRQKPLPAELIDYPLAPVATPTLRAAVAQLQAGEFQAAARFPPLQLGMPPRWDINPLDSNTWDFFRHSLQWLVPAMTVWHADGDHAALELVRDVIRDWHAHNGVPPGASESAWHDHAMAYRLRIFCWLWELYRTSDACEADFARELLTLIYAHAQAIAGGATYQPLLNHAWDQNTALLGVALVLPEFEAAQTWHTRAYERMTAFLRDNFSSDGFHLEQSPGYHWYMLRRLGPFHRFVQRNGLEPVPGLEETARRAAAAWPYLIQPNGYLPAIGDTSPVAVPDYRDLYDDWFGEMIPAAPPTRPNPRADGSVLLVSFEVGYAMFAAAPVDAALRVPDTYLLFRCNTVRALRHHDDTLSFVLYGLGQDWLIDPGIYSYAYTSAARQHVVSSRAHNVVLVDDADFTPADIELLDVARTADRDVVSVQHRWTQATHTRALAFVPPTHVEIDDYLVAADGAAHRYTQLFHVHPDVSVEIVSPTEARLCAADGDVCVIEQHSPVGEWRVVTGQQEPYWQGWYSPAFGQIIPAPVLSYACTEPAPEHEFHTRIRLEPRGSSATLLSERPAAATFPPAPPPSAAD